MLRKIVLVEFTLEANEDDTLENLANSLDQHIEFLNITSCYIVEKVASWHPPGPPLEGALNT